MLGKAAQLQPRDPLVLPELGRILMDAKRYSEAEAVLRDMLRSYPDEWRAAENLACSLEAQGRTEEAQQALCKAERLKIARQEAAAKRESGR